MGTRCKARNTHKHIQCQSGVAHYKQHHHYSLLFAMVILGLSHSTPPNLSMTFTMIIIGSKRPDRRTPPWERDEGIRVSGRGNSVISRFLIFAWRVVSCPQFFFHVFVVIAMSHHSRPVLMSPRHQCGIACVPLGHNGITYGIGDLTRGLLWSRILMYLFNQSHSLNTKSRCCATP